MSRIRQYAASIAVSLGGFSAGASLAWTSPALQFLTDSFDNSSTVTFINHQNISMPGFKLTTSSEAIVGAMLPLSASLFAIPAGKFAHMFGRKSVLLLTAFLYLLSWIFIGCARDMAGLVVARFLAGLALGGSCVVCPIYIGEIAEMAIKGVLGSFFSICLGFGVLYTSIIGTFANWIGLTVSLAIPAVIFGCTVPFLPETPTYLITQGKSQQAKKSLNYFRNDPAMVMEELTALKQHQTEDERQAVTSIDMLTNNNYRRFLLAGFGIFIFQQLCGINVVVFYTVQIFKAAGSSLNASTSAIIINTVSIISSILSVFIIERKSRRFYLIISAILMAISTICLGFFFHLKKFHLNIIGINVLPIVSLVVYMGGFCIGYGPIPWILLNEFYPIEIRGLASGIVVVVNWITCFLVTCTYPILMDSIGSYATFYLYGIFNVFNLIFICYFVPETKNKNLVN